MVPLTRFPVIYRQMFFVLIISKLSLTTTDAESVQVKYLNRRTWVQPISMWLQLTNEVLLRIFYQIRRWFPLHRPGIYRAATLQPISTRCRPGLAAHCCQQPTYRHCHRLTNVFRRRPVQLTGRHRPVYLSTAHHLCLLVTATVHLEATLKLLTIHSISMVWNINCVKCPCNIFNVKCHYNLCSHNNNQQSRYCQFYQRTPFL